MNQKPSFTDILSASRGYGRNSKAPQQWNGVKGLWPIGEGGGATVWDVAGGHNGTGNDATWVQAEHGTALEYDGSQYAVHTAPVANTPAFSAVLFIRPTAATVDICGKWTSFSSPGTSKQILIRNAGQCFIQNASDNDSGNASAPTWSLNEWMSIAFVADGTNISVWRDGVQGTPVAFPGPYIPVTADNWAIGRGHSTFYEGQFATLSYYNRALSTSEIQHAAQHPFGPITPQEEPWAFLSSGAPAVGIAGRLVNGGLVNSRRSLV